jgi:hypothetical protein
MQHRFVDFACTSIIFITIMIQGYCLNCENICNLMINFVRNADKTLMCIL